ncbi:hypothetical protein SCP_1101970 [Sparassis crispa]|uniref:Uncharacterized protein n=1 Tax=Sparassis crispa TaxID=139825 RepID=A0A401GZE6_9APHY|nr:hypothetical protein SCP_1101970 [Sparassis crispa]GBE87520.1 hypothetical protein SCP_1101970 [Sparassis crispa]
MRELSNMPPIPSLSSLRLPLDYMGLPTPDCVDLLKMIDGMQNDISRTPISTPATTPMSMPTASLTSTPTAAPPTSDMPASSAFLSLTSAPAFVNFPEPLPSVAPSSSPIA